MSRVRSSEPLVTFVTPVYNGASYIKECMESVLSQDYRNWECVVLDNKSSDNTAAIAESYARKDDRIRLYRNDSVLPIMANWNASLSRMAPNSRYCKVVHADDRLFPRCVSSMVEVAERHPTVGLVGAYSLWGSRVACDGLPFPETLFDGREVARNTLLGHIYPFLSPSSLLIRSEIIRNRKDFYPSSALHADVAACYEILQSTDFGFVHEVLTFIRRHGESVSAIEAQPLRRTLLSNLSLLVEYGRRFLGDDEYHRRLKEMMRKYEAFLAQSLLEGRPETFWHLHMDGIRSLGLPMSKGRLIRAAAYQFLESPRATLRRALRTRTVGKRSVQPSAPSAKWRGGSVVYPKGME